MVEVKCACGKNKRNFKVDVGSYVDECCIEAGYDELGKLKKKPLDTKDLPSEEELAKAAANLKEDPNEEIAKLEDQKEDKEEQSEDSQEDQKEETKEEKKARKKAEKAALMAEQRKAEKEAKTAENTEKAE